MPEISQARGRAVLATMLAPGDLIVETGFGGVAGRVTSVRVFADWVDVMFETGSRFLLAPYESCRVHREHEAAR